jgi:hypothetical protein
MFMVVIGTFSWSSIRIMHKIPLIDAITVVLVSGMTVAFDLAIAFCGCYSFRPHLLLEKREANSCGYKF